MESKLNTDEIVEIALHLDKSNKVVGEFMADHGLEFEKVDRALKAMIPGGDGRLEAARSGFCLGLQLGAMRLDPMEWEEPDNPPCNCLLCEMKRVIEGDDGYSEP